MQFRTPAKQFQALIDKMPTCSIMVLNSTYAVSNSNFAAIDLKNCSSEPRQCRSDLRVTPPLTPRLAGGEPLSSPVAALFSNGGGWEGGSVQVFKVANAVVELGHRLPSQDLKGFTCRSTRPDNELESSTYLA
jgi:hypothetical protein